MVRSHTGILEVLLCCLPLQRDWIHLGNPLPATYGPDWVPKETREYPGVSPAWSCQHSDRNLDQKAFKALDRIALVWYLLTQLPVFYGGVEGVEKGQETPRELLEENKG